MVANTYQNLKLTSPTQLLLQKIQSTVARKGRDSKINSQSIFRLAAVDGVGDGKDQQGASWRRRGTAAEGRAAAR